MMAKIGRAIAAGGAALACWMAAGALPAHAGPAGAEGADFVYLVEPGDTLIGLASRYMASAEGWRTLQRLNKVADPYRLVPGSRMRIPLSEIPEQPGTARVVFVTGQASADGTPLRAGVALNESARIVTGAGSTVTLELPDRTRVTLPPDTKAEVRRLRTFSRSGLTDTVLGIERGNADSRVAPQGGGVGRFELHTPMMVTGVRGTRYRVSADELGSRSEVLEGKVGVNATRGRAATAVTAGYGVGVSADGRLTRPIALLAAPELQPLPEAVLGPSVDVAWKPVKGAAGYRVSVARDAGLTELLWSGSAPEAAIRLDRLPEGDLHLAVSAVDSHRLTGHAAVTPFTVRLNPPAPFTLQPAADTVRYGETVGFEWATVETASGYELAVAADAGFRQEIASRRGAGVQAVQGLKPGRWWWRVRSLDAQGRPGPWSAPVAFAVEPAPPTPQTDDDGSVLRISWPAASDAHGGYRVQVAADVSFGAPIADQRTTGNKVELPRPDPGTYFVRIARAAADGKEAAASFSAPQRIEIFQYLRDGQGGAIGLGNSGSNAAGGGGGGIRLR